ncbi:hypothetical protein E2C01_002155 [Portunus trituberculatus]|uniref:Uncharacterized protein n=1 Tax=Portunus trituberculatus TaxID=210409 RepID=A0A5B7CL61_PORTR|nr:hypothetical protein [Portunus trituberculatus]
MCCGIKTISDGGEGVHGEQWDVVDPPMVLQQLILWKACLSNMCMAGIHHVVLYVVQVLRATYQRMRVVRALACGAGEDVAYFLASTLYALRASAASHGELVTWAPSAVFSILSLIAAVLSIILPETKGCNLSEENKIEKHTDMRGKDNFGSLGDTDYQTRLMKTTETADDGESVTKENVIKHLTDEYKC